MADCEERLAVDSSDKSSDTVDVSSSEYSEEENLASQKTSCDGGERTATAKTSQPRKKTKVSNTALDSKEMEDVAAWIFSSEEAKKVEQRIRSIRLKDPRVNSQTDRKHFAEHLLCATEEPNFQLLVAGFCRRFSTLAQESFASNLQNYWKASFLVSWMKLLTNFQPGKASQERMIQLMIVERLLRNSTTNFISLQPAYIRF